jgi:Zn-dependent protease with chaperone function
LYRETIFNRSDNPEPLRDRRMVTNGLTPDSGQISAQAFQVLGEGGLSDPDPNPINVFLFYSHPPIADRVRFCLTYDPWSSGGQGEFVK